MLERIKYIQNLGRFQKVQDSPEFADLTLVFSENGKGKTTLCSVLRALSSGSSAPLADRKRLGAVDPTRIVLRLDGGQQTTFDGDAWSTTRPDIHVFDEHFVDENVYSGLDVSASHRQGVHELVLGSEGVKFQRRVEEITQEIAAISTTIRERTAELPRERLHGLDPDAFLALQPLEDIDMKIEEARKSVSVLSDTEPIRNTAHFDVFGLPKIDLGEVHAVLSLSLEDLDQAALEAVQAHVSLLGTDSENWLAEGERLRARSASCPFCAQDISGSSLVNHYRAYFSEAYDSLLTKIKALRSSLRNTLSGDSLATFERDFQSARDNAAFWSRFIEVPEVELDREAIASAWSTLRAALDRALARKQARPLDTFELGPTVASAHERFSSLAAAVRTASNRLLECHTAIDAAKEEAGHGSLSTAKSQLDRLLATKERFTPEVDAICTDIQKGKQQKAAAETRKAEARQSLAEQRKRVFGIYQNSLNKILSKLSAEFSVEALAPSDRGRGAPPSTIYYLKINDSKVNLERPKEPGPSFGTVLSSGDRNTLALAFFFATLERRDLSNAIVVVDDPASSLDDGRQLKTIQRINDLLGKAHQLIVLSHREVVLTQIWNKADRDRTATMKIEPCGKHQSTLSTWDAETAAATDHDRLFASVRRYAESHEGEKEQVAKDLRPLLESFLRNSFPDHYQPGKPIGTFVKDCKDKLANGVPILSQQLISEIDEFLAYANRFHHSTNQVAWRKQLRAVHETELNAHAKDCIRLINKMRGTP